MRDVTGVAVKTQCQLGQVIGADREAVEVLQKGVRKQGVRRDLAHHDDFKIVDPSHQSVVCQQGHDRLGLRQSPDKRHHQPDILESHVVANIFQCTALKLEAVTKA